MDNRQYQTDYGAAPAVRARWAAPRRRSRFAWLRQWLRWHGVL